MKEEKLFSMPFAKVYDCYLQKAERKNRTQEEVDTIICWLTGYDHTTLVSQIETGVDIQTFFGGAPQINPNVEKITGVICGCRIEEMEEGLMKQIRYLDKLIDELAKGKAVEKILRK